MGNAPLYAPLLKKKKFDVIMRSIAIMLIAANLLSLVSLINPEKQFMNYSIYVHIYSIAIGIFIYFIPRRLDCPNTQLV